MEVTIGVDVGGTNTVIGVFDPLMNLIKKENVPTLVAKGKDDLHFLDYIAFHIHRVLDSIEGSKQLIAVGMGIPGIVDTERGETHGAVNMGWGDLAFADEMKDRMGVPVFIDNDVRVYTLGEVMAGSGKGTQNLVCVTLGTGIAAATLINGKIISGTHFYAGEVGHDSVQGNLLPCKCGKIGCLETVASATGIVRVASEALKEGKKSILQTFDKPLTAFDVYQASEMGDAVARDVFNFVGRTLGTKLVTITYLLNPEKIVIGGGAAQAGDKLLKPIKQVFQEQYRYENQMPEIITGQLGDSAGLIGAAYLARERMKNLEEEMREKA